MSIFKKLALLSNSIIARVSYQQVNTRQKNHRYMLFISRKIDESVIINNDITLTVLEIKGRSVKIGFDFPKTASVLRKELYDKIMAENMAAKAASAEEFARLMAGHNQAPQTAGEQITAQADSIEEKV
jgi:carbon storage regulator